MGYLHGSIVCNHVVDKEESRRGKKAFWKQTNKNIRKPYNKKPKPHRHTHNKTKSKSKPNRLNYSAKYRDALLSYFNAYLFQLLSHEFLGFCSTCSRRKTVTNINKQNLVVVSSCKMANLVVRRFPDITVSWNYICITNNCSFIISPTRIQTYLSCMW